MEIKISPSGKIYLSMPQQKWHDANDKIMQTSIGFITENIEGIEKAKSIAPEFAKAVLNKMHEMIEPK